MLTDVSGIWLFSCVCQHVYGTSLSHLQSLYQFENDLIYPNNIKPKHKTCFYYFSIIPSIFPKSTFQLLQLGVDHSLLRLIRVLMCFRLIRNWTSYPQSEWPNTQQSRQERDCQTDASRQHLFFEKGVKNTQHFPWMAGFHKLLVNEFHYLHALSNSISIRVMFTPDG